MGAVKTEIIYYVVRGNYSFDDTDPVHYY